MAKEYSRKQRVADELQRQLAVLIQREVKDPRIGMLTITGVEVGKEFEHAKVYFSVLGDAENIATTQQGLQQAAGFLRRELGKLMKLRTTPQLHFEYDQSLAEGNRLSALINQAVATADTDKDV